MAKWRRTTRERAHEKGTSGEETLLAALIRSSGRRRVGVGLLVLAGCGGGAPTPTSPAPAPSAPVSLRVGSVPLKATFADSDGNTSNYRIATDITVSVTDTRVHITHFTATITKTAHTEQGLTLSLGLSQSTNVSLHLSSGASLTQWHVLNFGVGSGETVTWSYQVSGTDSQGRSFSTSTGNIQVELAPPTGSDGA